MRVELYLDFTALVEIFSIIRMNQIFVCMFNLDSWKLVIFHAKYHIWNLCGSVNTLVPIIYYLTLVGLEQQLHSLYKTKRCCCLIDKTGLIAAASEPRWKVSNGYSKLTAWNRHSPKLKAHQNVKGFKASNGSLNGVYTNGNGVYVDGSC